MIGDIGEFYERLKNQLVLHEDLRLKPYRCTAGKLTIGVGRNLEDRGISKKEALYLLDNDIEEVSAELSRRLPWFSDLNGPRKAVLIDMAINLGIDGLFKFKRTLAAVARGDYAEAAREMKDSQWYRQVKSRGVRLVAQMRTGEWQTT
jgi:lysozyme